MATGTTLRSAQRTFSENHLECSICSERYKTPKILDCVHSFCENCLEVYYDSRYKGAPTIPCPLCRHEIALPEKGIKGLKTNFHLIGMVEDFALQEKVACTVNTKLLCEICVDESEALHRCLDCAQNICLNCREKHPRISALSNHTVATLEDIRQGKVAVKKAPEQDESKCHKHKGEVTRFYCESCNELICQACTALDHSRPEHRYIDSGEAVTKYKQSMKDKFPVFDQDVENLEQIIVDISEARQECSNIVAKVVKDVQDRAAEVTAMVKAEQLRLLLEITGHEMHHNMILDEHEKSVSILFQRKHHSLKIAKDITNTASDSDFLSLYPIISKDLESLNSHPPKIASKPFWCVSFNTVLKACDINLGKVVLKGDSCELCHEFGKHGSGPGDFNWTRGITSPQPDEIAVADYHNKRAVICNTDGLQKRTISLSDEPRDLAALTDCRREPYAITNQLVVVDNTAYVKIYNKDNTLAFEFPTVPDNQVGSTLVRLHSVAVKTDGTIIVGDVHRKVLTEHSPLDGSLIRTIPVETEPYYSAVVGNDTVAVCDGVKKVDVADDDGVTLFTIRPTIGGLPVDHCTGVCYDSSGFYVTMHNGDGTGHIHHYNDHGMFLSCVSRGLFKPQGITFTADGQKLAVADFFSVKMYQVE